MLSPVPGCLSRRYRRSFKVVGARKFTRHRFRCAQRMQDTVKYEYVLSTNLSTCSDFAVADRYLTHVRANVPTNTNLWSLISLATHHWSVRSSQTQYPGDQGASSICPLHSPLCSLFFIYLVGNQREVRLLYRSCTALADSFSSS
jgi:hypothetical protein